MSKPFFLPILIMITLSYGFSFICSKNINIVIHNETSTDIVIPDISDKYLKRNEIWGNDTLEINLCVEAKHYIDLRGIADSIIDGDYNVLYISVPARAKVNIQFKIENSRSKQAHFQNLNFVVLKIKGRSIVLERINKNNFTIIK